MQNQEHSLTTPLYDLHLTNGAKMVPFAGYSMPVNYRSGIIKEHLHTREHSGLFDVSHMGQIIVQGSEIATKLETVLPVDLVSLGDGYQKYALLLDARGGVTDDLMAINRGDHYMLVVNAACKHQDLAYLESSLGGQLEFTLWEDRALLALQGPASSMVLESAGQSLAAMKFMQVSEMNLFGCECIVSRSGYTGEDGFEISVSASQATSLAESLLSHPEVELIGLGARDSLRLEAGLCLYGQDMDTSSTPIEAGLKWAISPARRNSGARNGGFPGAARILDQLDNGADRKLVGLLPQGRAPMRTGTRLFDQDQNEAGIITSGGFSPSLGHPVSMGYVDAKLTAPGTSLQAEVRSKLLPVSVTKLPFVAHRYYR
jgi:aminomethyltransferase